MESLLIALGAVVVLVVLLILIGNLIIYVSGENEPEEVEAYPFPYVEYKGQYFPVLHTEYNRVWVNDPEQDLKDALEEPINVALEHEGRILGSYDANDDGTACITHWSK